MPTSPPHNFLGSEPVPLWPVLRGRRAEQGHRLDRYPANPMECSNVKVLPVNNSIASMPIMREQIPTLVFRTRRKNGFADQRRRSFSLFRKLAKPSSCGEHQGSLPQRTKGIRKSLQPHPENAVSAGIDRATHNCLQQLPQLQPLLSCRCLCVLIYEPLGSRK